MKRITILFCLPALLFFTGCNGGDTEEVAGGDSYYTCPMHPSVMSKTPGACPVCNMSLIKVDKAAKSADGREGNFITIDKQAQKLAGIETDTVRTGNIFEGSTIVGTVASDEEQVSTISSRVKGRIEKLHIKSTGEKIKAGTALYSIYSEELLAAEKEYLSLLNNSSAGSVSLTVASLAEAARNRLLLLGLTEAQVNELQRSGAGSPRITYYSKEAGYVSEVVASEGAYVQEGTPVLRITDLRSVWVEAQIYSSELATMGAGKEFFISSVTQPGKVYKGTLVYNNPVVEQDSRVHLIRLRVDNPDGRFIPGIMVMVSPRSPAKKTITVPHSAVLPEKMKTVWVLAHDNTFEQRMVKTGAENKYQVEIVSGLKEGEVYVSKGVYLVNSEYILKHGAVQRHEH